MGDGCGFRFLIETQGGARARVSVRSSGPRVAVGFLLVRLVRVTGLDSPAENHQDCRPFMGSKKGRGGNPD